MARMQGTRYEQIYAAAEQLKNNCFIKDGSLLFPGENLWAKDKIEKFLSIFENEERSDKKFLEKLKYQLKNANDDSIHKLVAECMYAYYLFPSNITVGSKQQALSTIMGWIGKKLDFNDPIYRSLDEGVGSGGQGYNSNRYLELRYLLLFILEIKKLNPDQRGDLFSKAEALQGFMDKIANGRNRQIRHMFLHLLFPSSYERISSGSNKRRVIKVFGDFITAPSPDSDILLGQIRDGLSKKHQKQDIDFYNPPIRDLWMEEEEEQPSPRSGETWSRDEILATVKDHFSMLLLEIHGTPFSKKGHRTDLQKIVQRSSKSIDFKHCNISAILSELGYNHLKVYKPLYNYQKELREVIEQFLLENNDFSEQIDRTKKTENEKNTDPKDIFSAPPSAMTIPSEDRKSRPSKFNPAARDARNKILGDQGEEFVFELEKRILREAGKNDLAKRVEWISKELGDGAGYDIKSFTPAGEERHIEVKATKGNIGTPFWISENEVNYSRKYPDIFCLYRVYEMGAHPRIYILKGALDSLLEFRAQTYLAYVKKA